MSRNYNDFIFARENTYKEVLLYSNFPAMVGLTNATITRVFCVHLHGSGGRRRPFSRDNTSHAGIDSSGKARVLDKNNQRFLHSS